MNTTPIKYYDGMAAEKGGDFPAKIYEEDLNVILDSQFGGRGLRCPPQQKLLVKYALEEYFKIHPTSPALHGEVRSKEKTHEWLMKYSGNVFNGNYTIAEIVDMLYYFANQITEPKKDQYPTWPDKTPDVNRGEFVREAERGFTINTPAAEVSGQTIWIEREIATYGLPLEMGPYPVMVGKKSIILYMFFNGVKFDNDEEGFKTPTIWLEKATIPLVQGYSKEQMNDCWDAALYNRELSKDVQPYINFEEYLSSITPIQK